MRIRKTGRFFLFAILKLAIMFISLALFSVPAAEAKRILFVPLDDRPVCREYTVDTLRAAGWEVLTPPREFTASRYRMGEPDKLMDWLEREAPLASAAVVSADAVIYGGLVASRTHDYSPDIIEKRSGRLTGLKARQLDLRLYVFSTIMRTPRASSGGVEPPYYEKWGPDIFRWGALADKQELAGLNKKEQAEQVSLGIKIPGPVLRDWLERRHKNLFVSAYLINALKKGEFDYLVMGNDDTAPYSQSHLDARWLEKLTGGTQLLYNYKMFAGADQLGLVLLSRAVNDQLLSIPYVAVKYAKGAGAAMTPRYEDGPVGHTIKRHIQAAGALLARKEADASLFLYTYTPYKGSGQEADSPLNSYQPDAAATLFIKEIEAAVAAGKRVAVADIAFSNGSSNALVSSLLQSGAAYRLASYAGWNTAGNTIGYALGQGLLAPYMDKAAHERLLSVRYLDEWAYQANARGELSKNTLAFWRINNVQLDSDKGYIEERVLGEIAALAGKYMPGRLDGLKIELPWNRMFEARIYFKR